MKKLIEAREAKVAELDGLVAELDEMEAGEDFDKKFARSNQLHAEIKDMNEKIEEAREAAETLKAVKEKDSCTEAALSQSNQKRTQRTHQ